MRIHLAADHSGYVLGRALSDHLAAAGHEVTWHGADAFDDGDDYPAFSIKVAQAVVEDEDRGVNVRGVIVGALGAGEAVTANKVKGIRAVPGLSLEFVRQARAHVDANVLTIGALLTDATADATAATATAAETVDAFIDAAFLVDPDDVRRIIHTAEYENAGTIEGWMIE